MILYNNGDTYEERMQSIYDLIVNTIECDFDDCETGESYLDELPITVNALDEALAQIRYKAIIRMIVATMDKEFVKWQDKQTLDTVLELAQDKQKFRDVILVGKCEAIADKSLLEPVEFIESLFNALYPKS